MALHDPHSPSASDGTPQSSSAQPQGTFGRYLLFKRLREDSLGEIYRAGQMGADAVERVVSLRLFNGGEIHGEPFLSACEGRRPVREILDGAPFGVTVELGASDGVAFMAQELVFGRSLAEFLDRSRQTSNPVPFEHTLHIMDRAAMALHNAYQRRLEDQRILHGFLIPEFVHLSNEGEIQVGGFEASPGLLALPGNGQARSAVSGYLSPEVNAGHAPESSDDVYSLGAIFAELLTGEPLPALDPTESNRWVETATLADGTPMSEEARHLLRESLLPRGQRIQSCEKWHRSLTSVINASDVTPTTFNLAFFLHTLFGEELDREVEVVEAERRAEVPPPTPHPVVPQPEVTEGAPQLQTTPEPETSAEAVHDLERDPVDSADSNPLIAAMTAESAPATTPTSTSGARAQAAPSDDSNRTKIIVGVVAAIAIAAALAFFVFDVPFPGLSEPPKTLEVTAAPRVETTALELPPVALEEGVADSSSVAPPLSPEEIEGQVRSLVAQRAGALEANLKAEYDERLVELRRQLEEARNAPPAEAEPTPIAPQIAQSDTPPVVTTPPPARPSTTQSATTEPESTDQTAREQPAQPAARQPVVSAPAQRPSQAARQQATPAREEPRPASREVVEPPTRETVASPEPAAPAKTAPGSIVTKGPGVVPPKIVQQPQVVYPRVAARLKRQATVKVRVLVNENGRPTEIEPVGKKTGLGFDEAAIRAAQTTRWTPPTKDGVPVKLWVELSIDFRP